MARMKAQFHLTFPEHLVREPVVYRLGQEFDVRTNIRRANVDELVAWFLIEVDGDEADVDRAVRWLRQEGVAVDRIPLE